MVREQQPWLDVPYAEKDAAKAAGALWDRRARRWYAPQPGLPALERWLPVPRTPPGTPPDPAPDLATGPTPDPAPDLAPDLATGPTPDSTPDSTPDAVTVAVTDPAPNFAPGPTPDAVTDAVADAVTDDLVSRIPGQHGVLGGWTPGTARRPGPGRAGSGPPGSASAAAGVRLAEALRGLSEPGTLARSARRRPPWRVLHAVPAGPGHGEIDHVLIGPPGVVTVTVEQHPGRAVRVDGDVLTVDGRVVDRVPRAREEAERAGRLLAAARVAGEMPPVTAALAVVAASVAVAPGGRAPEGVLVTTTVNLPWLLTALPAALADDEVDELYAVARRLGTWTREL